MATKKSPLIGGFLRYQQEVFSYLSDTRFQEAYSGFSSSHALRLFESSVVRMLRLKLKRKLSSFFAAAAFEVKVFMIRNFRVKNYMQASSAARSGSQRGTGIPWFDRLTNRRMRICREIP